MHISFSVGFSINASQACSSNMVINKKIASQASKKNAYLRKEKLICNVMNEAALTPEQRARLWHWRLGHPAHGVPVEMTKSGAALELGVTNCLNEDCIVCIKKGFKKGSFKRQPLMVRYKLPNYHRVYVDGFGGQKSFGVKSYHGAVGGFIFVCSGCGAIEMKLYASKSQFPRLLEKYLLEVIAKDYAVRVLVMDTDQVQISKASIEPLLAEYGVVLQLASVETPQENSLAENAVQRLKRGVRALLNGAPHIQKNRWGVAGRYYCYIMMVTRLKEADGKSPYEMITGRPPKLKSMFFRIFGSPIQFKTKGKRLVATDSRTSDGFFMGIDPPAVLVDDIEAKKIRRVSRKEVQSLEYLYCKEPKSSSKLLKELLELQTRGSAESEDSDEEHEVPKAVESAKPLHDAAPRSEREGEEQYTEDNKKLSSDQDALTQDDQKYEQLKQLILDAAKKDGNALGQLFRTISSSRETRAIEKEKLAKGVQKGDVNEENIVKGKRKRRKVEVEIEVEKEKRIRKPKGLPSRLYQCPTGTRVRIAASRLGEKYAKGKSKFVYGTIKKKGKQGVLHVLYDDDAKEGKYNTIPSHWSHLEHAGDAQLQPVNVCVERNGLRMMMHVHLQNKPKAGIAEPYRCMVTVHEALERKRLCEDKNNKNNKYPRNFWQCLVADDWREWMAAIQKELKGWIENQSFKNVRIEDRDVTAPVIELGELYLIKRNGSYKHRLYALGNQMREGDYMLTKSKAVAAETVRFCISLAVGCGRLIKQGDTITAYLQSEQRKRTYCYRPSHADFLFKDTDDLSKFRRELKKNIEEQGECVMKDLSRKNRHNVTHLWELTSPIYGQPDSGQAYEEFKEHCIKESGGKKLFSDKAVYYFQEPAKNANDKGDSWCIFWSHTDDFGFFGSDDEYEQMCCDRIDKHMKMEWQGEMKDYTSIEIRQNVEKGFVEMSQPKYWEELKRVYKIKDDEFEHTPLPEKCQMPESTESEHEKAKHLPYMELVGSMLYAAVQSKLEMRYALSQLGRFLSNWTEKHYKLALHALRYGIATRNCGIVFTRGLDKHGCNVMYCYADSNFQSPRSTGGHTIMMNGAAIVNTSKKHSTVDVSTTAAELTELFNCALSIKQVRNISEEIGLPLTAPTLCYQDNQPCCAVANGTKALQSSTTKAMDVRVAKVQEMILDDQELTIVWIETSSMVSDINTKSLGRKQFQVLRDKLTGYELARKRFPEEFGEEKTPTQQLSMSVKQLKVSKCTHLLKALAEKFRQPDL